MSAEIINLRRVRKQRARQQQAARAGEARLKAGRSKAMRRKAEADAEFDERRIEGHRRDPDGEPGGRP
jgi:hypothetical protein